MARFSHPKNIQKTHILGRISIQAFEVEMPW